MPRINSYICIHIDINCRQIKNHCCSTAYEKSYSASIFCMASSAARIAATSVPHPPFRPACPKTFAFPG